MSDQIASWRSISIALVLPIILQRLVEGADIVDGALEVWSEVLVEIGMVCGEEREVEASCLGKHSIRNWECNLSCIVR